MDYQEPKAIKVTKAMMDLEENLDTKVWMGHLDPRVIKEPQGMQALMVKMEILDILEKMVDLETLVNKDRLENQELLTKL